MSLISFACSSWERSKYIIRSNVIFDAFFCYELLSLYFTLYMYIEIYLYKYLYLFMYEYIYASLTRGLSGVERLGDAPRGLASVAGLKNL